ncbi:MAG: leucyl/phenylalanyl-tRNA--protein transferase [Bdellovibrionota bacterium]
MDRGKTVWWFQPAERGILFVDELHIGRTLRGFLKNNPFRVTFDQAFEQVIKACAAQYRPDQLDDAGNSLTWISPKFIEHYIELHKAGYAHSVEVWNGDRLVGGTYGVHLNGVFAGESMFHTESNASKVATVALVEHLKARGIKWIDIQSLTNTTKSLGGRMVKREEHLRMLREAQAKAISFYP